MAVGVDYTTTVEGELPKHVECEGCGREYGYVIRRKAAATRTSYFLINSSGAQETASREARANLTTRLRTECDEVPCPACGHYQSDMVPLFQSRQLRGMRQLALWLFGLAAFLFFFGPLLFRIGRENVKPGFSIAHGLALAAAVGGGVVLFVRQKRIREIDPNEVLDEETRKQRGKRRAMNRKQFLLAFYPERLRDTRKTGALDEGMLLAAGADSDEPLTLEAVDEDDREDRRRG